jgi:lysophospholipase L1-like esterase
VLRFCAYARSGARTVDLLTGQVPGVRREPDVSVLLVGTNDVIGVTTPATLTRSSRALLNALVRLVDVVGAVGSEFVNDEGMMSADSFHPSAAGYGRIADALVPAVLSVLETAQPLGRVNDHPPE